MSVYMYVTIVTLRYKTKTKGDKKLIFAGVVDHSTSNIFISSKVMGGKKS